MFGYKLFTFVAETTAPVVERFGRYHKTLRPGFNWLVPIIDRVSKYQTLKETAIKIENQQAITKDNVTIHIEGYVFIRIVDPFKATYNVSPPCAFRSKTTNSPLPCSVRPSSAQKLAKRSSISCSKSAEN